MTMATIIDSLVVSLGLDPKDMASKAPAAVKNLEAIEKKGKDASKSVEGLTKSLGGLLALIGGTVAIKAFITDFITVNAQLDRLSQNLNLSVSTISAWSNATERLGGSAAGLQGTLDMLSKSQTELMLTGQSALIPYFSALGVSLADAGGKARPLDDILLDLSDRFSKMDRTTANNMGRMMGVDQGTMNLLLQGRKELELTIQRQKEHNAVTKAQAEQATKFQKSLADTKQSLAAVGRSLLMDAAPALEKLFGLFQEFASWIQGHEEFIADFLKVIAVGLAAIALAASPITLTTAAVVALAAGIALLWQDYQTWKRGGDSLIDWGKWEPGIEAAIHGIERLRTAFFFVKQGAKEIADIATGNWASLVAHASENPPSNSDIENSGAAKSVRGIFQRNQTVNGTDYFKKFFTDRGWSPAQAAGITANLISESGGRQNAIGDKGSAFGLGQWHSDRQANFAKWAGHDIRLSTMDEQLAFVNYELTQGGEQAAGRALRGATSAADAGAIVSRQYERPADANGEASRRGSYAASLLGIPGASRAAAGAGGAGSGGGSIDRSTETHIGEIKIYTAATDAKGIASDMGSSLDYLFASQANAGLN
jgi:hypothetical protein